jgi:hypothetical protein
MLPGSILRPARSVGSLGSIIASLDEAQADDHRG